jgi:hypothetical protein
MHGQTYVGSHFKLATWLRFNLKCTVVQASALNVTINEYKITKILMFLKKYQAHAFISK